MPIVPIDINGQETEVSRDRRFPKDRVEAIRVMPANENGLDEDLADAPSVTLGRARRALLAALGEHG